MRQSRLPVGSSLGDHKRLSLLVSRGKSKRGSSYSSTSCEGVSLAHCQSVLIFLRQRNIFEIEWNRFPTGFICQSVSVCVCVCVPKFCCQSKLKNLQPRPAHNRPNEENVVSVTVFHCFASLSPATQPTHRRPKACLCVSVFLWKFTKTFRRHFVYFSCCCYWGSRKRETRQLEQG